jgi:thiol-disulfide isomerase/thioredoxin
MIRLLTIAILFTATTGFSQKAEIVKLERLQKLIQDPSHSIQIVNFWATWCAPCVKELPLLEKLNADAKGDIKVTLVSMDMNLDPNPEKVYKFIARKNLKSTIVILDEQDPNMFIDKIEKQWTGALPATLVINTKTGIRKFVEKELHDGDLEKLISEVQ